MTVVIDTDQMGPDCEPEIEVARILNLQIIGPLMDRGETLAVGGPRVLWDSRRVPVGHVVVTSTRQ